MRASAASRPRTFAQSVLKLPRRVKRLIMVSTDAVLLPAALWLALALKFDRLIELRQYSESFVFAVGAGVIIFSLLGLYRAVIHFMGLKAIGIVVIGVTLSVLALGFFEALV